MVAKVALSKSAVRKFKKQITFAKRRSKCFTVEISNRHGDKIKGVIQQLRFFLAV